MDCLNRTIKSLLVLMLASFLMACGSDDDDNTASEEEAAEIALKLIGTWTTDCELDMDGNSFESYESTWVISETAITNSGTEYSDNACTTSVGTWGPTEMTYTLGESTSTTNGYDAYPLDVTTPDGQSFTMISLQNNDTELHIATGTNDGSSAANRQDEFLGEETRHKQ